MSVYGIYLCRIIIKQQLIINEICRTCPKTCRIYAAEVSPYFNYTSVTSHLLTEHNTKIPLGSSSAGLLLRSALCSCLLTHLGTTVWDCYSPSCVSYYGTPLLKL